MAVTAQMVKELREKTGAGIANCQKALKECDGDMEQAVLILREKGLLAAAKKSGRIAAEGLVCALVSDDNSKASIVEVNSETDFVAKNADFQNYVKAVAEQVLSSDAKDIESFLAEKWIGDTNITVQDELNNKISVIGENLKIRRFDKFVKSENGLITSYIHGGGKVGVLLELSTDNITDEVKEAGKNIAMQIAAMSPQFISRDDISADYIAKETAFLKQQAMNDEKNQGKPENIIEKMIEGRLNKELREVCLNNQIYVKDESGKNSVEDYLKGISKNTGAPIKIARFVRFATGEGIEKKEENFADEVNKAING